ncbi:MAG: CARDB domain-containing protein [Pseudomonadota bacterium]
MLNFLRLAIAAAGLVGAISAPAWAAGTPSQKQPDLTIESAWLQRPAYPLIHANTVSKGQPFNACFSIKNLGAPSTGFRVAGSPLAGTAPFRDLQGLPTGVSKTLCLTYPDAQQTNLTLTLTVDSLAQQAEQNEGNNTRALPLKLASAADLQVLGAWLQTQTSSAHIAFAKPGQAFAVCFNLKNLGQSPSGVSKLTGSGYGGVTTSFNIPQLGASATTMGCLNYPAPTAAGSGSISLTADALNQVAEGEETNNVMGYTFSIHN